jgi:hypothetical protein
VLREERLREVVPGDRRDDGVDPWVGGAEHEGEGAAVRAAGHPEARVAAAVEPDVGPGGEQIDEGAGVGDLVVRVVEVDPPCRRAEATRRVGEDDVAAAGEVSGAVHQVGLAAAEPVGQQHCGMRAGRRRGEDAAVEQDGRAVGFGAHRDRDGLLGHGLRRWAGRFRRLRDTRRRRIRDRGQERRAHRDGRSAAAGSGHERA